MDLIQFEKTDRIGVITLAWQEPYNPLNLQSLLQLQEILASILKDLSICCVIIRGQGEKAFSSGMDVSEMINMDPNEARAFSSLGSRVLCDIENLDKPVIAAVKGYALGSGLELALCCDFIIAGRSAVFGQPEVSMGVTPCFGGTTRASRRIGLAQAKRLLFTGEYISAEEAFRIGLADLLTEDERVMDEALSMAKKIRAFPPRVISQAKACLNMGAAGCAESASKYATEVFASCFSTPEQRDGMLELLKKK